MEEALGWYPGQNVYRGYQTYKTTKDMYQKLDDFESWIRRHKELIAISASLGTLAIAFLAYRRR